MKNKLIGLTILVSLALGGCSNFFHDLIPSDGNRILTFEVAGQLEAAVISDYTITVTVDGDTDITNVLPKITISAQASIIPVTLKYIEAAFPGGDIAKRAVQLYSAQDLNTYIWNVIENNPDFNIPAINIPIDFTSPVNFMLISGRGSMRQYTVRVVQDTGEPKLIGLRFSKYDNPDLMNDALCHIDENAKTVYAYAKYPAEMGYTSFPLIPSFEIIGDKLEINGAEIKSGADAINFNAPGALPQTRTITVHRNGLTQDYSLVVYFEEDKDTIRSITDFRFTKDKNPNISVTAVGSIVNNDNFGTITVQVYYSGIKPDYLTASFVTPGTITVNGVPQTTGVTVNDFSSEKEYRVTSRNGLYMRTYTVKVEFINVSAASPTITSFRFSQRLNEDLVQDCVGVIGSDLIMLDVSYGSNTVPYNLVPEFSAGGIVTVSGSVQVSGASRQNYSRQVKYTVTNPENPILTRDYWVQTRFVQDYSSSANITTFGFYPEENPESGIISPVMGKINQDTGRIYILAPFGSGLSNKLMIPRFTAAGQVSVNSVVQESGVSGIVFSNTITYTVVSANGRNTRVYKVMLKELRLPILVDCNAKGMNDGTSWEDAFISLQAACEAASFFPDEMEKEIWIAKGTYRPGTTTNDYFQVTPNTSYIGGFAGNETSKEQADPELNKTIISGDVEVIAATKHYIRRAAFTTGNYNDDSYTTITDMTGNVSFENLEFRDFMNSIHDLYETIFFYHPIFVRWGSLPGNLKVLNCSFFDVNTHCINQRYGNINISNIYAQRIFSVIHSLYESGYQSTINNIKIGDQFGVQLGDQFFYDDYFLIRSNSNNTTVTTISNLNIENCGYVLNTSGSETNWIIKNIEIIKSEGGAYYNILIYGGTSLLMENVNVYRYDGDTEVIWVASIKGEAVLNNINISNIKSNDITQQRSLLRFSANNNLTLKNSSFNFDNRISGFAAITGSNVGYLNGGGFRLENVHFNNFNPASGNLLIISGNYPFIIKRQGSTYNGASLTDNTVFNTVNNLTQKYNGAVLTGE